VISSSEEISLTPRFSEVLMAAVSVLSRFNGFRKPLKTVAELDQQ